MHNKIFWSTIAWSLVYTSTYHKESYYWRRYSLKHCVEKVIFVLVFNYTFSKNSIHSSFLVLLLLNAMYIIYMYMGIFWNTIVCYVFSSVIVFKNDSFSLILTWMIEHLVFDLNVKENILKHHCKTITEKVFIHSLHALCVGNGIFVSSPINCCFKSICYPLFLFLLYYTLYISSI